MNKQKNKYSVDNIREVLFFPLCGLMILYCLIKPVISAFEYIRVIQFLLLIITVFMGLSIIFTVITKSDKDKNKSEKNITWEILKWIFIGYLGVYLVLQLDTISVYFNYLMVLIYGIVAGYRLRK
jgi:hypothetical protein